MFSGTTNSVADAGVHRLLAKEIQKQDHRYGTFAKTLGASRLAIACLEDETREARDAWREERKSADWQHTREELLQVAAVAMRAWRDLQ